MFKTVDDFIHSFKTCLMNNFASGPSCSIQEKHDQLIAEIRASEVTPEEKEICLQNVERAYRMIKQDLFGREEEEWKLK
ncbi:hypothetical protein [Siminovitchia terrae]|uniref:Uncharacterized protein n=1 Tax=Siminovitchia terrae TaxID=1914933 RepID=A0A429XBR2_SIMTE|nr:hypothetical protein [Siminovitchia terrae]RST60721.1 hypothetical protein D5F11_005070 [Siminovitchia terrae]GIN91333.1 hypothetical protein J22TS1_23840 [Siminovitchia terrae]